MLKDILQYNPVGWGVSDDTFLGAVSLVLVGAVVVALSYAITGTHKILGKMQMRKREKFTREVQEAVENIVVCGFSEAIANKRITLDDARELYARFAHVGFWGLHPRKFTPVKTGLDLQELKERLRSERTARENKNKSSAMVVDKFLGDIATELG